MGFYDIAGQNFSGLQLIEFVAKKIIVSDFVSLEVIDCDEFILENKLYRRDFESEGIVADIFIITLIKPFVSVSYKNTIKIASVQNFGKGINAIPEKEILVKYTEKDEDDQIKIMEYYMDEMIQINREFDRIVDTKYDNSKN